MRSDDDFLEVTRFARAAVARFGSAGVDVEVAAYPDGRCRIVLPFAWARVYVETLQAQVADYNEKLRRAAYQETIRRAEAQAALPKVGKPPRPRGMNRKKIPVTPPARVAEARSAIPESPDRLMRLWAAAAQARAPLSFAARRVLEVLMGVAFDQRGGFRDWETEEEIRRYIESMTTRLTDYHLERIPRGEILAAIEEVESWWREVATSLRAKIGHPTQGVRGEG